MITKFKIFEKDSMIIRNNLLKRHDVDSGKWDDHKGSYVLLRCNKEKYSEFIENNIGIITKVYYPGAWFEVEYENLPKHVEKYLRLKGEFNTAEIMYISKNREDLEAILAEKKYNL